MPDYPARLPRRVFPPSLSYVRCREVLASGFALTPCQQTVALLIIAGCEDREIAKLLDRRLYTAKAHLKAILMRTNQTSRTGAASTMLAALWSSGARTG